MLLAKNRSNLTVTCSANKKLSTSVGCVDYKLLWKLSNKNNHVNVDKKGTNVGDFLLLNAALQMPFFKINTLPF